MKMMMRRAAQAGVRLVKRFLADKPNNNYERVAFQALRDFAFTFGKAVA